MLIFFQCRFKELNKGLWKIDNCMMYYLYFWRRNQSDFSISIDKDRSKYQQEQYPHILDKK